VRSGCRFFRQESPELSTRARSMGFTTRTSGVSRIDYNWGETVPAPADLSASAWATFVVEP